MLEDKPDFKGKTAESVIAEILYYAEEPINGIWAGSKIIIEESKSDRKLSETQIDYLAKNNLMMTERLLLMIDKIREWRDEQKYKNE